MKKDYSYLIGKTIGEALHELGWWWTCIKETLPVKNLKTQVLKYGDVELTVTYNYKDRVITNLKQNN